MMVRTLKTYLKKNYVLILLITLSFFTKTSYGAELTSPILKLQLSGGLEEPQRVSVLLEILFLLTILSIAPAIILTVTSFTRIIIVFSFLRQAMGIQQMPPNQVLISLAIFMTFVIMYPVGSTINKNALQPYLNEEISFKQALKEAEKPIREFLFKNTREKDLSLFFSVAKLDRPKNKKDVPTFILIPAFMISELKTAF